MKRKLLFLAALVASAVGFNAHAQTDCTNKASNTWTNQGNTYTPGATGSPVLREHYVDYAKNSGFETGKVLYQTISNLDQGYYKITLYANANYTPGRGWDSEAKDGDLDRTFIYAEGDEEVKVGIPVKYGVGNSLSSEATITAHVGSQGTLEFGITKDKAGSNWHSIGVKSIMFYGDNTDIIKSELSTEISTATGLQVAETEKATLTKAIAAAQTVYDKSDATFTDIENAIRELQIAEKFAKGGFSSATSEQPVATDFVQNGTFASFDAADWPTGGWAATTGVQNHRDKNGKSWENWTPNSLYGKLYYRMTDIPNGAYSLSIDAFCPNSDVAYVYANNSRTPVNATADNVLSTYTVSVVVNNNILEIGLYAGATSWVQIDNVKVSYTGDPIIQYKKLIQGLIEEGEALVGESDEIPSAFVSPLETALATYSDYDTYTQEAQCEEAYSALETAVGNLKIYIQAKENLAAMKEFTESTNVYTAKAYEDYYGQWAKKYDEGTLTLEEASALENPTSRPGHRAANKVDDLLLSAWTIGGEQAKDYDKALYINTWSVEGDNDGSDFTVPFFEYWTGDANSLGANTLSATVTGLNPGEYEVSALVRVRAKDGTTATDATGITLSVNDGETVDVTEGTQVNTSPFTLAEYKATGTVGEDGELVITLDVAADNNISWLSFKNVNYTKLPTVIEIGNYNFDENPGDVVTVTTRGYGKDVTGDQKTGLQPVQAWTPNPAEPNMDPAGKGSGYTGGVFAYGSSNKNNNQAAAPATNPEGGSEGVALALSAVWSGTAQYTQNVTLPAGNYVITYPVYNGSGTTAFTKSLFGFIAADGTEYLSNKKSFKVGEWETETVEFTLYQETTGDISVGFISVNDGTAANQHLFVDHVKVVLQSDVELADAQEYLLNKLEGLSPVGEGLFYYQADEIAAVKAAIEAAKTQKEIDAIEMPTPVLPVEGKPYVITNTVAAGSLNVGEKITVETDAIVYFTPVNGGYAISNSEGEYIFKTNTGSWDNYGLANTAELANAYVISVNPVEGGYTLNGPNGSLGTDTAETGAVVYANKGEGNTDKPGNYIWAITEYAPTVTVSEALYATYVTPFDVEFGNEVEAYIVSGLNEDNTVATLTTITEAPKGTPVVIKAAKADTYELKVVAEAEEVTGNLLKVATGEETGAGFYVLANLNKGVGFYALDTDVKVPAGKAYLNVPAGNGIKFIGFEGNGDATGIQGVENAAEVENGAIYNLAGQRVQNPTKGIYIVNGKKVLVK